jgi:hypothetical protein
MTGISVGFARTRTDQVNDPHAWSDRSIGCVGNNLVNPEITLQFSETIRPHEHVER